MTDGFFFDARYIRVGHHDGISRFSAGLFAEISQLNETTAIISDLRQLDKLPAGTKFVKVSSPTSIFEPLVALQLNKLKAKIVFSPMQTMGSFGRKYKLVLTVHDLIYYSHPAPPPSFNFLIKVLWRLYHLVYWPQRLLLNRADAVVTVSNTTKNLISKNNLTTKPVSVVYNAAEPAKKVRTNHLPGSPRTLVYMGSFMDYKNVEVLIEALAQLPGYQLNLLSRIDAKRKTELEKLIPNGAVVNFLNGVSDEEYQIQLAGAAALVSGSKDEGFGIPLVEAMAIGTPVVVSEIAIFKEIGESAAVYFDPDSADSFAKAVRSLEDPEMWEKSSALSTAQASKFSWRNSSLELLRVINSL
jgi:glycosyltransferase involved in cell wall biosynthesis